MKILLTTTSFQDTPGKHHELLNSSGFEVDKLRGPVTEEVLLPIIKNYDGVICGDDDYTEKVIKEGKSGKLKVISKYGIGLDRIDLKAAKENGIIVCNTPGINHTTVAEHTLALLLSFIKNVHKEHNFTQRGEWSRMIGTELLGKTAGIIGLGKVGKEVAKRLIAFGVKVIAFDLFYDEDFLSKHNINKASSIKELVSEVDVISINAPLTKETRNLINEDVVQNHMKKNMIIVNTSRAAIINLDALINGLEFKILKGYLTDVLEEEPMIENHPLLKYDNVIITPHIGSRTYENVEKQGCKSILNLIESLSEK